MRVARAARQEPRAEAPFERATVGHWSVLTRSTLRSPESSRRGRALLASNTRNLGVGSRRGRSEPAACFNLALLTGEPSVCLLYTEFHGESLPYPPR